MSGKKSLFVAMAMTLSISGSATYAAGTGVSYQQMADSLHAVLDADRSVYTKLIVNRLQNDEKVITASEHWKDDKALLLPAQMFRAGAEAAAQKNPGFSYSLQSLWAVNKQNSPKTAAEKEGLTAVAATPDKPFYKEEKLGDTTYFTAVYPDRAISKACVSCHNDHRDSPRKDFKLNDVMGGIVIRIPMK
jgi:hypothetical protein